MEDVNAIKPKAWGRPLRYLDPAFGQVRELPLAGRFVAAAVFAASGFVVAAAGVVLLSGRVWIAEAAVVVIVESLAFFMLLMACYCLVAQTTVGRFAQGALRRAVPLFCVVIGTVASLTALWLVAVAVLAFCGVVAVLLEL